MSYQNGTQYFANTSNATVVNPRITHVNGNAYFNSQERNGGKLLLENISKGAFHDAAERGDPPKCHPHTREAIRAELMEWIKAPEVKRKLVIWTYGPAGSGKTAIAQSIAEECNALGLLAASFFFSRTAAGRNDATRVIATVAYQISRFIPEMEEHLFTAIERDPTIFSRKLATQIQGLIIDPLKLLPASSFRPIFVILDGVDECGPNSQSPSDLLNALGVAISELQHLPLMFFVASRPEYEIRQTFSGNILGPFVHSVALDDTYKPDEDIRVYFNSKFQEICDRQLSMGSRLSSRWPTQPDIDLLVSKASGQFIFAATVIKFIDSPRHHPAQRLDIILGLSFPGHETPFALLDELYRYILTSVVDLPKVLKILTLLILGRDYGDLIDIHKLQLGVRFIEELLEIDVRRALVDMHALIFIPPPGDDESTLRIHHASLYDFLMDKSRSHELYIDVSEGHAELCRRWLQMAVNHRTSEQVTFAGIIRAVMHHMYRTKSDISDDLAHFDLKKLFDGMNELNDLHRPIWLYFFQGAQKKGNNRSDVLPRLLHEFDIFVLGRLSKYPPSLQACIPTFFVLERMNYYVASLFRFVIAAVAQSQKEFDEYCALDSKLLDLHNQQSDPNSAMCSLFLNRSRAGRYYAADRSGYLVVAKLAAKVIFPKHDAEFDYNLPTSSPPDSDGAPPTFRSWVCGSRYDWFVRLLSEAPVDKELAMFLRDRALQYGEDMEKISYWKLVAKASLLYVQRSEISHLKHTHAPGFKRCIVCDDCIGVSVVPSDQLDLDTVDSTRSPPMSISRSLPAAVTSAPSALLTPRPSDSEPPSTILTATEDGSEAKEGAVGKVRWKKAAQGFLRRFLHLV